MEFQETYLKAMADQAPQMFNRLRRSGAMDSHLKQKTAEAYKMLRDLLEAAEKTPSGLAILPSARAEAERQVLETLVEFPPADE